MRTNQLKPYVLLNSPSASGVGMLMMAFGLWQMYAKLYYLSVPRNEIQIHTALEVSIALVVAVGFAMATTVVIVQSKKMIAALCFSLLDFMAGLIYFKVFETHNYGGGLISFTSAAILFALGELFVRKHQERMKASTEAQRVREEKNAEIATLRNSYEQENEGLKTAINGQKKQLDSLEQMIVQRDITLAELSTAYAHSGEELEQCNALLAQLKKEYAQYKDSTKEWKTVYDKEQRRVERMINTKRKTLNSNDT